MHSFWQDLRFAARIFVKTPGFTAVAILTLALGIGANTAMFSLTDQVLLRLLPVERPKELVMLRSPGPQHGHSTSDYDSATSFSYPMYKALREQHEAFSGLLARFAIPLSIVANGQTERANGELVSGDYFEVLGVRPALGRMFSSDDETTPGANPVAVLSYGFWTRRFGNDPSVLNKQFIVNGASLTVVGVSRAGFDGVQVGELPDVFIPMTMKAQMTPNWDGLNDHTDYWLAIIARLKPGFTAARAQTAIAPRYHALLESELQYHHMSAKGQKPFTEKPLLLEGASHGRPVLQQGAQEPLIFLMGMVGLVLLIACANLASLLVARGEARQREIAVRLALGAGRWRLVRQLLTESLVLCIAGGAAGVVTGWWALSALVSSIPRSMGAMGLEAKIEPRMLLFAIALSVLTGVLFGFAPAMRATRAELQTTLKDQGANVSVGTSGVRLRKGLIVSQVALTAVLLAGAGLFARSLMNLRQTDLGVKTDHVLQFSIAPALNRYTPAQTIALFDRMREGIGALPGVRGVTAVQEGLFEDNDSTGNITAEGYTPTEGENTNVERNAIAPGHFATMGIPLISGREFTNADVLTSPRAAIVNEKFAKRFFRGSDPIHKHFGYGAGTGTKLDIEIVGVVKDSKHLGVRDEIKPFAYTPYAQDPRLGSLTFYLRTTQDPAMMGATIQQTVATYDANLPLFAIRTLEAEIDESMYTDRLLTFLSLCMGGLAALLAAVGLYGVMAYVVARRTREIGIRMALGATRGNVAWLILREVIVVAAIGLGIGLCAAYFAGKVIESELYGVKGSDPTVFAIAALLLAGVAMLAGFLPARKAAGVDPMVALRYE
jgi:predicted permease